METVLFLSSALSFIFYMDKQSHSKFISHPLLKSGLVEQREYQIEIAEEAKRESTMVVLPTGLGKTTIALLVMLERLQMGKILFLAPTRPLVEQHSAFLKAVLKLDPALIQTFTGTILPDRREMLWEDAKIIVSTPQIIENDLLSNRISLAEVSLLIFDECHRAVGNYSYVYIADKYREQAEQPLILGMTASPGSEKEKIREICTSLGVKRVESRTEYDPDVAPYVYRKDFEWRVVEVPAELKECGKLLEDILERRIVELHKLGLLRRKRSREITKTEILELKKVIESQLSRQKHADLYKALSLQAEVLKIKHAIDLIETEGIFALRRYLERLRTEALSKGGSKASRRLLKDEKFVKVMEAVSSYKGEHPKLSAVIQILKEELHANQNVKVIVFTNYRDTAEMIINALQSLHDDAIRAVKFIGQASKGDDRGLKQKEQVDIVRKFKNGTYNVLIATSVAEEGLDIPATDVVLFYEPIPSAIRSIQRKGRTARKKVGKVIVLIAKGTKDEAYYWLSRSKEQAMRRRIREMQMMELESGSDEEDVNANANMNMRHQYRYHQQRLTEVPELRVFVDMRETRSGVVRFLEKTGMNLILKNLEVGDYVVSDRVCIERKSTTDFIDSLVNKRRNLLEQMNRLKSEYEKPLLIIEGDSLYGHRNVHPNVLRAVLASIAIDYSIPILHTRDEADTASLIYIIARREQMPNVREVSPHGKKPTTSLKEQQEYFISALSNVGIVTARNLLRRFKTIERVVTATKEELMEVEHVGEKTAEHIREVLTAEYRE